MKPTDQMTEAEIDAEISKREASQKPVDQMSEEEIDAEIKARETEQKLPTMERVAEEAKNIGKGLWSGVESTVGAIGDVINYLDAPMREAIAAPAKIAKAESLSDVGSALVEPALQFLQSGDDAPTMTEVASMYGASDQKGEPYKVLSAISPTLAAGVGLLENQEVITPEQVIEYTPTEAQAAGIAGEALIGGKGLSTAFKAAKGAGSGISSVLSKSADALIESPKVSNLVRQGLVSARATAREGKKIVQEFLDPNILNKKEPFGDNQANLVKEIFGDDVPSPIKFTPSSEIVRLEKGLADRQGGGEFVEKHNQGIKKIWNYISSIPSRIASKTSVGMPLESDVEAGKFLINRYNEAFNQIFKQADFTRNSALSQFPLGEIPRLSREAKSYINSAIGNVQASYKNLMIGEDNIVAKKVKEMVKIMDDLKKIDNMGELNGKLTSLGELAFAPIDPQNPVDTKKLKLLYHNLNQAFLEDTRFFMGDDIADNLIANNMDISEVLKSTDKINDYLSNISSRKLAPETAFKNLVEKGDSEEIAQIKKILSDEDFEVLRASYLNNKLMNSKAFEVFEDDLSKVNTPRVKWATLENSLARDNAFSAMFDKAEQNKIYSAIALGRKMGDPYASRSGTGLSAAVGKIKERMILRPRLERQKFAVENQIGSDPVGISGALLPIQKQNVMDQFEIPMMTPQQIDADPSLSPTQRAKLKNQIYKQPQQ